MNISRSQLRRIIKEELRRVLKEADEVDEPDHLRNVGKIRMEAEPRSEQISEIPGRLLRTLWGHGLSQHNYLRFWDYATAGRIFKPEFAQAAIDYNMRVAEDRFDIHIPFLGCDEGWHGVPETVDDDMSLQSFTFVDKKTTWKCSNQDRDRWGAECPETERDTDSFCSDGKFKGTFFIDESWVGENLRRYLTLYGIQVLSEGPYGPSAAELPPGEAT